jgi:hypothetical protein
MAVSFGCPLVLAWLVFMYYRFVDGWLTSLSALGQGLAAMTVLVSVGLCVLAVVYWRRHRRSQPSGPSTAAVTVGHQLPLEVAGASAASQVPPVLPLLSNEPRPVVPPTDVVWSPPKRPSSAVLSPSSSSQVSSGSLDLSFSLDSVVSASDSDSQSHNSWNFSVDSDDDGVRSRSSRTSSSAGSFNVSISIATTMTPEGSFASSDDLHSDEDSDEVSGHMT